MKIENKYEAIATFNEIPVGECFLFNEEIYIKISVVTIPDTLAGYFNGAELFNCVELKNGTPCYFSKGGEVFPIKAKIVIEKD